MSGPPRRDLPPPPAPPLREIRSTAQDHPRLRRRWFNGEDMDLFLWQDRDGGITRLQLCFSDRAHARALTWDAVEGYRHDRVDEGESRPARHKMAPVLLSDGRLDAGALGREFQRRATGLPDPLVAVVLRRIEGYRD